MLDVKYLISSDLRQVDRSNTIIILYNLLKFSFEKRLLKKYPFDVKGELIVDSDVTLDNLTPFGLILFDELVDKWLGYTDNEEGKIDRKSNIKMLDKYYNKLVSEYQEELGKVALWQSVYEEMLKEPLLLSNP